MMRTKVKVELDAGAKTFASGLLPDLIAALRGSRNGDLVAVISSDPSLGPELEAWCRFTRNSLVDMAIEGGRTVGWFGAERLLRMSAKIGLSALAYGFTRTLIAI